MTATLFIVPSEKIYEMIAKTLKEDVKSAPCIYVCLNKPVTSIKKDLEKRGVNTDKFYFIDCVTASVSKVKNAKNILYTSSPEDLTGLDIAIDHFLEKIFEKKYLFIESLRTLLIYNSENVIERFITRLIAKTEKLGADVAVVMVKGRNFELVESIIPSFDKVKKG